MWYALNNGDVIHNDASSSAEVKAAILEPSKVFTVEDEGLSTLVWGSNKYVRCMTYYYTC